MAEDEPRSYATIRKVMTMSIVELSDPEFVCNKLLSSPGGARDAHFRQALEVKKVLEDMKATRASRRIAWLALIVALGSFVGALFIR